MPLALMVGFPSSGKSTLARSLKDYVEKHRPGINVVIVRDEDYATFSKNNYNDAAMEKEQRGRLRSAAQNLLNDKTLVILDALNYIKGYRYELFCAAKAIRATYCVIYCDVDEQTAKCWNDARPDTDERYSEDTMNALIMRFEAPEGRNRWDSPLFVAGLPGEDGGDRTSLKDIDECLHENKPLLANKSTQSLPQSSTNFLYELDRLTQEIVTAVIDGQKMAVIGDQLSVPESPEKVEMRGQRSLAELSRLRRQFIAYTKMHPVEDKTKLATMFVTFINNS